MLSYYSFWVVNDRYLLRKQFYLLSLTSCIENGTAGISRKVFCCLSCRTVSNLLWRHMSIFKLTLGGGFQLMTLRKLLLKDPSPATRVQNPIALVYDSTPGDNGLEAAIFSNAPRNPLFRLLVVPVIALVYGVLYAVNFFDGNRPLFEELRSTYLEANILPSISNSTNVKAAPRLYVYSKKDNMTLSKYVESHIKEANLLGLDVTIERFENSSHVAHARQDPDRYWGAVRKVWSRALQQVRSQL